MPVAEMQIVNKCPRCPNGTMELKRDHAGEYWDCIQCGYHKNDVPPLPYCTHNGRVIQSNWIS